MPFLSELAILGIKAETTQDTAITMTATDFTYAKDVAVDPVEEFLPRDYKRSSLDQLSAILGKFYVKASFKLPVRGSGTRGTPLAPLGAVLQAAGHSEVAVGGTSVTYAVVSAPASASFYTIGKSATLDIYLGQAVGAVRHQIKGCVVSSLKITFPVSKIAYYEVEIVGLYVTKTNTDMPTQTYNTTPDLRWENSAFSYLSVTPTVTQFDIDYGIDWTVREDSTQPYGIKGFMVAGRKPKAKLSLEEVPIAMKDYLATMIANTEGQVSFVNGATSGNISTFTMPKFQMTGIKYNRGGKLLMLDIDGQINQNSGDDSISLVIT